MASRRLQQSGLVSTLPPHSSLGRYGGASGDERRARRREQLLAAGLEVFGTVGYAASTVKSICAEAELTERYFYESFRDQEELLRAVFERLIEESTNAALSAADAAPPTTEARARAGLTAWFHDVADDRRRARVMQFEAVGASPQLDQLARSAIHAYATYIATAAKELAGEGRRPVLDPMLTAMSLVGAGNELLNEWLLGTVPQSIDEIIEHCVHLYVLVAEAAYA